MLVLLVSLMLVGGDLYSQTARKNTGNMYTQWMKLALLGKNQAEIEYFFRNVDSTTLDQIKQRIRFAVIDNLKRSGIHSLINKRSDIDDINVLINKIVTEIRYVGMEHDEDLRMSIKEEFGILLENL